MRTATWQYLDRCVDVAGEPLAVPVSVGNHEMPTLAHCLILPGVMKRSLGFALVLALVSATGCAARQTTTPGRGPVIQKTDDSVERDHGDLTRPVFGQGL